jgi:uncharacterized protein
VNVFEHVLNGSWSKTGLPKNHPLVQFALHPDELERALALDDTVIWGALPQLEQCEDASIAEFATRLRSRKLLKCFDVRASIKRNLKGNMTAVQIEDLTEKISARVLEKSEIWRKGKEDAVLLDLYSRSPYKKIGDSKGSLNQIRVRVSSGKTLDLAEISSVVGAIRPYNLFRYYFDEHDHASAEALASIVKEEVGR